MKKRDFAELVFCAIEAGDTNKVQDLYKAYPEFKDKVRDRNNWTPVMYACRYGNVELLAYFYEARFAMEIPGTYGLFHIASFAGELPILRYLIEEISKDPNPLTVETTPLKFACKYQRFDCIDYLFHKGAFLIDANYLHNMLHFWNTDVKDGSSNQERVKYKTIKGTDILPNMLFKVHEMKDDKVKHYIRWLRFRNFAYLNKVVDTNMSHMQPVNKKLEMFKNPKVRKTIGAFL